MLLRICGAHKQCFVNEFELVQSTMFLKFRIFHNTTLYNVYPMFITFSSSAKWIMLCTVSWRLAIHYLFSVAVGFIWLGSFLSKMQCDWIFTSYCRELSFNINFLYIFPIPMWTVPFMYLPCFMSSWILPTR